METFDGWGQVGAYVPLDPPGDTNAVRTLLAARAAGNDGLREAAHLVVDGVRIRADIDSVTVGWLPADVTAQYMPDLAHLAGRNQRLRVTARVQVYSGFDPDDSVGWISSAKVNTYLSLAEPHLLRPLNPPPSQAHVELPEGRKQKVAVTAEPIANGTGPWIRPEGSGWVHCHLRPSITQSARSSREVVEVCIDSTVIGTLTPAMSKNFLPLVKLVLDSGRLPVARGLIKGNRVQVEMSVAALKASEVSQAWLRDHDLHANANDGASSLAAPQASEDPIVSMRDTNEADREPGFYQDPHDVADERFWDGFDWTTRIRMRPKPRL